MNNGGLQRVVKGLLSLAVLTAVVLGVPLLLFAVGGVPSALPSGDQVWTSLISRDDGQVLFTVLTAGVWVCWAMFTVAMLQEAWAAVAGRPARRLRGFGAFQAPAAALVTAVALLFAGGTVAASPGHAAPLPQALTMAQGVAPGAADTADTAQRSGQAVADKERPATTYEVQRRDTLWGIAEAHLGDPLRYQEIAELNAGVVGEDNRITAGMQLVMPADAVGLPSSSDSGETVSVSQGDTLWELAEEHLGSGERYPELFQANAGRAQADGDRLTDPEHVEPGWSLQLPGGGQPDSATTDTSPPETAGEESANQDQTGPIVSPHAGSADAPAGGESQTTEQVPPVGERGTSAGTGAERALEAEQEVEAPAVASRYAALAAGGGLLAGAAVAALVRHRRRQFRHRRPGRVIAGPPAELVPLEKALLTVGGAALDRVNFLDLALRSLVASSANGVLPQVVAACLDDNELQLILAEEFPDAPQPWRGEQPGRLVISRDAELPVELLSDPDVAAPYPCLVSVGHADTEQEWLLDLEHVGFLSLTGDPDRCVDLARYIAAELSNNSWSDHLTVTLSGFGANLVAADPGRLAYARELGVAARQLVRDVATNEEVSEQAGVDVLTGRARGVAGDVWMPQVLLAAAGDFAEAQDVLAELRAALPAGGPRRAVAVVTTGERGVDSEWALEVGGSGELTIPALGLHLVAHQLPEWLAGDLAEAIALARDGEQDVATPPAAGDEPWEAFGDAAGALLAEHTVARDEHVQQDGGLEVASSVLPLTEETYLQKTAATAEDVVVLAPAVRSSVRVAVEIADERLDADVQAWHDAHGQRPKLTLLGPVTLQAHGRPPEKQTDFCTEVVAYIARHRHGVSSDKLASDLWPGKDYTGASAYPRGMVSRTRHWLGVDQEGRRYLPEAVRSGGDAYRVEGILIDLDLFKRLRTRGSARGAEGVPDLVAALGLVSGVPLSQRRAGGFGWLDPGEEYLYTGMVVDVAHVVATHALGEGNTELARMACEVALSTGSSDDIALLDLAAVDYAEGRFNEAEATIGRILLNNGKKIEEDLPPRTYEVLLQLRKRQWVARAS